MPRSTVVLVWLVAALAASSSAHARETAVAAASPAPTTPTFAITGRGWGHGVGMSQWGAYGFAQRGYDYARIVGHYYRGTSLGRAPVSRVRVLLVEGRATVNISSEQPFTVRDDLGQSYELRAGAVAFGPGFRINVDGTKPQPLPGPVTFTPGSAPLRLNGKRYRGSFEVAAIRTKLRVINSLGLEAYLYGVVPDEVPHTWPSEALKAQAVVARSYALAQRKTGAFDLYDDTRSQVYNGIDAEEPQTNAAVNATAGQVLLYGGRIATAYFFSTSGGRTANVADVWGATVPYLVSVPDPYDSASPHHSWGPYRFTPARLAQAIGVRGPLLDVRTTVNGSARVDRLVGVGALGEASISGSDARRKLGLRSTWFRVGVLALDRPTRALVYGSSAQLTGIARGLSGVTLEQRASATVWERAAAVTSRPDGRFAVTVKPLASASYRLAAGTVRSAEVRVAVAPLVRLAQPREPGSLSGTVRPVLRGAAVIIERRAGAVWRQVATARVDERGSFAALLDLVPGTYRARTSPGRGFVTGYSQLLDVVAP